MCPPISEPCKIDEIKTYVSSIGLKTYAVFIGISDMFFMAPPKFDSISSALEFEGKIRVSLGLPEESPNAHVWTRGCA